MNMMKNKMYYVIRLLAVLSMQIAWIITLLALSIHVFDVTILCVIVFSVFLCVILPLLYENVHSEISLLKRAWK